MTPPDAGAQTQRASAYAGEVRIVDGRTLSARCENCEVEVFLDVENTKPT